MMMSRKRRVILIFIVALLVNIGILRFCDFKTFDLTLVFESNVEADYQLFFSDTMEYSEENSMWAHEKDMEFLLQEVPEHIRLDFINGSQEYWIQNVYFTYGNEQMKFELVSFLENYSTGIEKINLDTRGLFIRTEGEDPYIQATVNVTELNAWIQKVSARQQLTINLLLCIMIDVVLLAGFRYINRGISMILEVLRDRKLILNLGINDFKTRFAGSYLGVFWAFVQPVITIVVYWFVFQVCFKNNNVDNVPYVLWFICGLIPWFFFSEAISGGTNSLIEYSYLVKKVVFRVSVLPVVKIVSALFVHLFFLAFLIIISLCYGNTLDFYLLQLVYYAFCMIALVLSITYATSAIVVFFRDMGQVINILLQIGMWVTPIMWNISMIGKSSQWIVKLNPMYYIVQGYRDSIIYKVFFWERMNTTVYFWGVVLLLLTLGLWIFKRLRIHFADVL